MSINTIENLRTTVGIVGVIFLTLTIYFGLHIMSTKEEEKINKDLLFIDKLLELTKAIAYNDFTKVKYKETSNSKIWIFIDTDENHNLVLHTELERNTIKVLLYMDYKSEDTYYMMTRINPFSIKRYTVYCDDVEYTVNKLNTYGVDFSILYDICDSNGNIKSNHRMSLNKFGKYLKSMGDNVNVITEELHEENLKASGESVSE